MPRTKRFLHHPYLPALLGYLLLAALFYLPILSGLRTFPDGDFTYHFLPFSLFQRSELLAGRLPVWNPYTYGGHPFLADTQAAVFYPVSNLLLGLTLSWGSPGARLYWLEVEAVLQVAMAGFFTYLLVRELTGCRAAAFLAGCVFAFSGYLTGYPPLQLAVLRTAIWLPLLLWLLLRAFAGPGRWSWWIAASMAYTVAFLGGHPQTFLYISYATAAWIALLLFMALRRPSSAERPRAKAYLVRVGAFYLLFLALSAAQMLPSLEFTRLSVRASVDFDFVSGGFPLQDTWQMLLPRVLTVFSPLYVGIIPLGLALFAVVLSLRRGKGDDKISGRAFILFFALLALLALLVSYGQHGFLYAVFYRWLPGWKLFRGQERAAYLVAFALSVLAGFGAAALVRWPGSRRRWVVLTYSLLAVAGILIFTVLWQVPGRSAVAPAQFLRIAVVNTLLLIAWTALSWRNGWSGRRWVVLIILVMADLTLANVTTNISDFGPGRKAALKPEVVAVEEAVAARAQANLGLPGRVYNEYRAFDDYGMRIGAEDVWGSSPLRLARFAALFDQFPLDRMWRLTGVEHVLTWRRELFGPSELLGEYPQATDTTYLHRLPELNPRAWVASDVKVADDGEALQLLADHGFDLAKTAIVPPSSVAGPGGGTQQSGAAAAFLQNGPLAAPGRNEVSLERPGPGRLRARVHSDHGGLLVASENWMPGWQAVERGEGAAVRALPVTRADLTFLGVPIGPGDVTIDLAYRPASVRVGLVISSITLGLLGLVLLVVWRQPYALKKLLVIREGALQTGQAWRYVMRLGPFAVALIALAARAFRLDYQELRGDETFGYFFSLPPVRQIIESTIALREPHPVGSYLLEKAWLALAGQTEFALRFTSLWFGVLAVALLYRLGRRLEFGRGTALLAAALLAVSPYAIWHSQDARMYSISLALTIGSTLLMLEAIARRRWQAWAAYVVVSWMALQVHYFAFFVILAQNLFVLTNVLPLKMKRSNARTLELGRESGLFASRYRSAIKGWLLAQAMLVLLYLPWLIAAGGILTGYRGNGDSPGFVAMLARSLSVFAAGETIPAGQRLVFAALGAALVIIGGARLAIAGPPGRQALWLLFLYLAVPLLATWVSALSRPIFNERYLVAAAPPFYLLIAVAAAGYLSPAAVSGRSPAVSPLKRTFRDRALRFAGVVALVAVFAGGVFSLGSYYFDPAYSKTRGWRELAAAFARLSAGLPVEAVRLAQSYPDPTLWYYYGGPVAHLVLPPAAHDRAGAAQEVANLAAAGVERVILASQPSESWDDQGIAEATLSQHFTPIQRTVISGWPVWLYVRPPAAMDPLGVSFENGLTLAEAAIQNQRLVPGDVLVVSLRWAGAQDALSGSEKITLQLLDAGGALVAQTDLPFGGAEMRAPATSYAILVPWQLPAGEYRLIMALYDPAQPGAPRLLTTAGADHVELGTLRAP